MILSLVMRVKDLNGNFGFYVPLSDALLLSAESGDPIWLQVAEAGEWFNVRHGEVPISLDDLKTMHRNFTTGLHPPKPQELPSDYEHLSFNKDRKPGDGIASGWFKSLELRDEGRTLWALIDFTDDARAKIKKKEYKGFSPVIHPNWITHGKKEIGPTLLGGALTNYQTIPSCVLTMSLDPLAAVRDMADILDLPLSDRERRVRDAFAARFPEVKNAEGFIDWEQSRWFRDADDQNAYYTLKGKIFGIAYSVDDALNVTFDGEPFEVVSRYEPVVSLSGVHHMKLKNAQGQEVEIPAESLAGLTLDALGEIPAVRDLRAKVPAQGTKVVNAQEFDTLSASVTALSSQVETLKAENTANAAAAKAAQDALIATEVDGLIAQGRILPKEKDRFLKLANVDRAEYNAWIADRKAGEPLILTNTQHGGESKPGNTGSAVKRFDDLIEAKRTANPKLTYVEAIQLAQTEQPDLARARNAELAIPVGPGGVVMTSVP